MTKGSDFDMRLTNGTKYKVNSMRLTNGTKYKVNSMRLTNNKREKRHIKYRRLWLLGAPRC